AGLLKPEFLSGGNARMKKANQLMQKLMEYFYDFIIPEVVEGEELECDTDLERQNVEEMYEHVRLQHQSEGVGGEIYDVQHQALIPVLRPYQSQAVNWMLSREKYRRSQETEQSLHFLWRDFISLCGKKLFYNPFTGCEEPVLEFPAGGAVTPGGILADEMGLGKTVEVLALILMHSRGLQLEESTLPQGKTVNYYVPPPPLERKTSIICKTEAQPKLKISYPTVRVMLLAGIKEMKTASYGCDFLRNRGHVKKTLMKLIDEGLVVRVKGRGLAGSFKLGKKCKESEKTAAAASKTISKVTESTPRKTSRRRAKDKAEEVGDPPLLPSPDSRFECLCGGELGFYDGKHLVQCLSCDLWQHALCVNYLEESRSSRPFYCPHCLVAAPPLCSGATLIISPSSICHQWGEEIQRHVHGSELRVLVYQGVKRHGFLQPRLLAQQDVVITTYDVLRSELNYVDIPHSNSEDGRRFRNRKRYMAVPSPLVAVQWWRICLDEAQMVECPTAKAAEMALRLSSVNRWCVSGTPVQRGLEDLYGLVLFLGVDPFWVKHWWLQILYRPFRRGNTAPLYRVIAQILWRSAKKDVIDQIQIPPQTEEVHWLNFSPVEGHFYHRQHEVCSHDALLQLRKVSDWSLKLGSLDRRSVQNILNPLLRLRQACCHPQAVRGEFLPLQKR
ncbi:E3 ubiquitin-protein ligase SHPRH, partial [Dissostichus eleginoides]